MTPLHHKCPTMTADPTSLDSSGCELRRSAPSRRCTLLPTVRLFAFALATLILIIRQGVDAFPIVMQIDEDTTRCIRIIIPEGDDGHLIFVPLPNEDELEHDTEDVLEMYYIEQVYASAKKSKEINKVPSKLPDETPPTNVAQVVSKFLQNSGSDKDSKLVITVTNDDGTSDAASGKFTGSSSGSVSDYFPNPENVFFVDHMSTQYFESTVLNHIAKRAEKLYRKKYAGNSDKLSPEEMAQALSIFKVCFRNGHKEAQIQVVFEVVLGSEDFEEEFNPLPGAFDKQQHLTPLEKSLDTSIQTANTILREMKYMEKRERRMKQTADSINSRMRYFSYLSIGILLLVTYLQVTYLKRYFHKKKLM
jgi:p24 family protein delta-1